MTREERKTMTEEEREALVRVAKAIFQPKTVIRERVLDPDEGVDRLDEVKTNALLIANTALCDAVKIATEEIKVLRAVLVGLEWISTELHEFECPQCGQSRDQGHLADCCLKAALGD